MNFQSMMELLTAKEYRPQVLTVTIEGKEQQVVPKADWDNLKERHDELKTLVEFYERGQK